MEASPAVLSGWPGVSCCSFRASVPAGVAWSRQQSSSQGPAEGEAGESPVRTGKCCVKSGGLQSPTEALRPWTSWVTPLSLCSLFFTTRTPSSHPPSGWEASLRRCVPSAWREQRSSYCEGDRPEPRPGACSPTTKCCRTLPRTLPAAYKPNCPTRLSVPPHPVPSPVMLSTELSTQ